MFDVLQRGLIEDGSDAVLVSLSSAVVRCAVKGGVRTMGILGTGMTMRSTGATAFYRKKLAEKNIEAVFLQNENDRDELDELIRRKLVSDQGSFTIENANLVVEFVKKLELESGNNCLDAVALACTELPMLLEKHRLVDHQHSPPTLMGTRIRLIDTVQALIDDALVALQ